MWHVDQSVHGRRLLPRLCLLGMLVLIISGQSFSATTYATWITIWYGHDQAWWSPKNPDASKNFVGGKWKTLDRISSGSYNPF